MLTKALITSDGSCFAVLFALFLWWIKNVIEKLMKMASFYHKFLSSSTLQNESSHYLLFRPLQCLQKPHAPRRTLDALCSAKSLVMICFDFPWSVALDKNSYARFGSSHFKTVDYKRSWWADLASSLFHNCHENGVDRPTGHMCPPFLCRRYCRSKLPVFMPDKQRGCRNNLLP